MRMASLPSVCPILSGFLVSVLGIRRQGGSGREDISPSDSKRVVTCQTSGKRKSARGPRGSRPGLSAEVLPACLPGAGASAMLGADRSAEGVANVNSRANSV
jgi:hypothetical protein